VLATGYVTVAERPLREVAARGGLERAIFPWGTSSRLAVA
jgi:hypothetical protein